MFGAFKRLFQKEPVLLPSEPPSGAPEPAVSPTREVKPATSQPRPEATAPGQATAAKTSAAASTADNLSLPLKPIIARLPGALANLAASTVTGNFSVPLETVLAQLPKGVVKISFGQLRQNSPPGTFADNPAHDQTLIELPLPEILSRLNPAALPRRAGQKKAEVPDEVGGIFGAKGQFIRPPSQTPATPTAAQKSASILSPQATTPFLPAASKPAPTPPPISLPKPTVPVSAIPMAATPASASPDQTAFLGRLIVPVAEVSQTWPGTIHWEIDQLKLKEASLGIPMNRMEQALKTGRILFTWDEIRRWFKPTPITAATIHAETTLELPLKVVAPLFIAQYRPAKEQKKTQVGDNIPNLFSSTAGAVAPPPVELAMEPPAPASIPFAPAPAAAAPVPAPKVEPVAIAPAAPIRMATPPAADPLAEILGATKKNWTPQELVQKTSALKGVAGSLIAMGDGLLVASQMPDTIKSETVSAFLPQIFGRMNQYSKELKLGELTNLTMVVGNVPCQIFKTGTVYLVALGRAGENLPAAQLTLIAEEIARQNK